MRIYISGSITGRDVDDYTGEFLMVEKRLKQAFPHSTIFNPIRFEEVSKKHLNPKWEDYMIYSLEVLKSCDIICFTPTVSNSTGVEIEELFADKLNLIKLYANFEQLENGDIKVKILNGLEK